MTLFTRSFISSFHLTDALAPDAKIFFWIHASAANASAVNYNGIKTLLVYGVSTFSINGKSNFIYEPASLPKNSPHSIILESWAFDNFLLADRLFAKALQRLETFLLANVWKLRLPIIFDDILGFTSVSLCDWF